MPQQKAHPIQLDRKYDDHSLWRGGCLKPTRLKPCMTYDDPVVLPIHHNAVWAPDHSMITRLRKDKCHWWAPAKARSCPRQGRIEPLPTLTSVRLKSSPSLSWNDRWPVAGEGVLANMRRCTSDVRTRGGNSYRSVVGFHGKWLPSRGWLPRARALAPVLWHGVRYRGQKGREPKIPTAA